ncbi:MAG: hypothetical protein WDA03_10195 [Trueperaceae bacterium]
MTVQHSTPELKALFGRVRLEPWGVDHVGSVQDAGSAGAGYPDDQEPDSSATAPLEPAALEVEEPLARWRPLAGRTTMRVERTLFLDGVRRVEARLLIEDTSLVFGALGSCGVAAVACSPGAAPAEFVEEPLVQRWCALGGGRPEQGALLVQARGGGQGLHYTLSSTPENDVDAPVRHLQAKMQEAERLLAARLLAGLGNGLLLCDGPRPLLGSNTRVLGYIKTVQAQRLPPSALEVVRALAEGQRSPLYLVGAGEFARFEWYLRLRNPGAWAHTLAGSVRLQAYAGPNPAEHLEWAREVADWSCSQLPRFATRSHQDPRAPQQLLPVRALESTLRRRLGSAPLLRRRVLAALPQGGQSL